MLSTRTTRRAWLAVMVLVAACGSPSAASRTPPPSLPSTSASPTATADACAVGAQSPPPAAFPASFATALAFAPDGRLFYTERAGTVRVWQNGAARTFATVPTVTTEANGSYSERGLLGLAISPTFASDRFVYAFYSDANRTQQHVIRWRDCAGVATGATVLITLPSGPDCCHKGGRLAFGHDGMLYVTLGEEHTAGAAQNTSDPRGKVLRYRPDGGIPADNPFGAGDPVWAYGLRNPFGIAVSASGQIAVTNNGPSGDAGSPGTGYDTLILALARGGGYQWPLCYGYSHPLAGSAGCAGRIAPDWSSESGTVVPTGAAFVDSAGPQPYAGHLVFCTFDSGMRIATPGSPHAAVTSGPSQCRLAVVEGPDHALYLSDTGRIYRLG
ncbi:MAG TPA: PQQ-dependent sugar dehydrogenase [Candidatus Dormibacteraeota bacterium]|nr:PQQ-dependent sugar dehydrogenase [Candidatus Dormibacteraeota bacterium]